MNLTTDRVFIKLLIIESDNNTNIDRELRTNT